MPPVCSVEVGPPAAKGEGRIRRHWKATSELVSTPEEGINTLYDVIKRSTRLFPDKNAVGARDIIKVHNEEKEITKTVKGKEVKEKKTWTYYELSDYKFTTWKQFGAQITEVASGLRELGLDSSKRFNIYSSTRPTWQLLAQACSSQSITFATSYDSLGEEGLQHSLDEPEVVGMFTNANLLGTLAKVIGQTPTVKYVIYDDKVEDESVLEKIKSANEGVRVLSLDELKQLGKEHPHEPTPPKADDVACIMYTSGSTGKPKGVLLTHRNVVSAIAAGLINIGDLLLPSESYIAFLPLAHILEFAVEMIMLYIGIPIGYGSIKTLTENSTRNCLGDIRTFRPTVMAGVPAVWELIRKGILSKVHAGGAIKERLFHGAVAAKKTSRLLFGGITDAVVFKQVKTATGGRLKYAVNGGAALSRETQEFLEIAVVQILGGYGLTETTAMASITHPDYYAPGIVGLVMPCSEIKLVDFPDAGYYSTNNPPQGEVYIRGNSVTKGYFKRDDATKENLNDDGWLMTGDIGQWNANGTLSIIDRKKNLVKLSGGEYIAIERLESVYKGCSIVANICVVANPDANKPAAIIFPHEVNLKNFAADKGIGSKSDDLATLCSSDKVNEAFLQEVNAVGKRQGFKALELLQAVVLTEMEWTPANGMLTAAQKLQRKVIQDKYKDELKKVYP